MKRRHFLQVATTTLTTLGVSQLQVQQQSLRYGQALAQPTPRKLALLVGVNRYPESDRFLNLRGAATDAEMQRQLLISRFRFHPSDICVLSDEADFPPTRDNILTAFDEHLIQQAKPGDVVVFHFSGHGSRVLDPDPIHEDDLNSTFVPGDAAGDAEYVDDIMGRTLFLLTAALETDQVTAVLDSCYSGGGTRGNLRIRAADGGSMFKPSDRELNFQERWLSKLEAKGILNREAFLRQRRLRVARGMVIAASQRQEAAAELTFDGFDAGAFTYLLTQFLFQRTDAVGNTIARIRPAAREIAGQLPLHEVREARIEAQPPYFVTEADLVPAAEAVVASETEGLIWLGGVPPEAIAAYRSGTTLLPASGGKPLTIVERRGLLAKVDASQGLGPQTPLREAARVVPGDVTLAIGVDPSLAADFAQIQTHLDGLPYTTTIAPAADGTYGTPIDYILSRMTPDYREIFEDSADLPEENALGLFSPSLSDWVPGSFASPDSSLRSALIGLTPKFQSLLAVRLVTLSFNAQASRLAIAVEVTTVDDRLIAASTTGPSASSADGLPSGPLLTDEPLRIQVTNQDSVTLYLGILGIFPTGQLAVLYPETPSRVAALAPGQTQTVPDPAIQTDLVLENPGRYEVVVLASPSPFTHALQSLDAIANGDRAPEAAPETDLSGVNGLFEGLGDSRSEQQVAHSQTLSTRALVALSLPIESARKT